VSFKTYSLDEVADCLGCTSRWLIEKVRAGQFPAHKIARHWRFTESDVDNIFAICANDFRDREVTPVWHAAPLVSGLTATSRKRLVGK
jgi:excisionase family DNA binding protein